MDKRYKYGSGHRAVAVLLPGLPGNKTAAAPWPDPYKGNMCERFHE